MKIQTLFTDSHSGMSVILDEFNEWHPASTPDGYSDDDGTSVHVQLYVVKAKSGHWLKQVRYNGYEHGREKTIVREMRKRAAINWLYSFSYYAKYSCNDILHCDNFDSRFSHCPYLKINKEGKVGCELNWDSWGYGTGWREMPVDRKCDITSQTVAQMLSGTRGFRDWVMDYWDYWRCVTGEAKRLLDEPEHLHEYLDESSKMPDEGKSRELP